MRSITPNDMQLISRDLFRREALEHLYNQQRLWFLFGAQYVVLPHDNTCWECPILSSNDDEADKVVDCRHIFWAYRAKLGHILGLRQEKAEKDDQKYGPSNHKTRIEVCLNGPLMTHAIADIFYFTPRYRQHIISFRAPSRIARIPEDIRQKPPYLMTGQNLFVEYTRANRCVKACADQNDPILFAMKADTWRQMVSPQWLADRTLRKLGL